MNLFDLFGFKQIVLSDTCLIRDLFFKGRQHLWCIRSLKKEEFITQIHMHIHVHSCCCYYPTSCILRTTVC